ECAAALVIDQEVLEPERAHRLVEGQQLEAAHAEHRSDARELEHLGERLPAVEPARRIRDGSVHAFMSFTRAAMKRATISFAEMPISPPHCAARSFTAVTKPSRYVDGASPMRALQALTQAPAIPRASSTGNRAMPAFSMPKSASL